MRTAGGVSGPKLLWRPIVRNVRPENFARTAWHSLIFNGSGNSMWNAVVPTAGWGAGPSWETSGESAGGGGIFGAPEQDQCPKERNYDEPVDSRHAPHDNLS